MRRISDLYNEQGGIKSPVSLFPNDVNQKGELHVALEISELARRAAVYGYGVRGAAVTFLGHYHPKPQSHL